jgi:hypothetical protein
VAIDRGTERWSAGHPEPAARVARRRAVRRADASGRMAVGTLACPVCDAPVAPGPGSMSPADALVCPMCDHVAAVRDFLSLATPQRPARVQVRVVEI